jgi:hypothetical protein
MTPERLWESTSLQYSGNLSESTVTQGECVIKGMAESQ